MAEKKTDLTPAHARTLADALAAEIARREALRTAPLPPPWDMVYQAFQDDPTTKPSKLTWLRNRMVRYSRKKTEKPKI